MKTLLRLSLKKAACRGKDTVGTGFSSNYRSFIFGKLPPPACPGLCYVIYLMFISILTIFSQSLEIARGYLLNLLLGRVEQGLSKFKVPAGGQQKQPGIFGGDDFRE